MKMTPCSLVEIYERIEQPAGSIFKVEDKDSVTSDWFMWLPHVGSLLLPTAGN
jgi:hypothetical protein